VKVPAIAGYLELASRSKNCASFPGAPTGSGHAQAMVLRDRNHPSIVRWSQCNEPNGANTDSTQFEADLFNAMTKLDGTRPISVDSCCCNAC
jgi:hypothetical protein